jgi:hypothetical protein
MRTKRSMNRVIGGMLVSLGLLSACAHQRTRLEVADSLSVVAKDLLAKGQPEEAIAVLRNAQRLDPDSRAIAELLRSTQSQSNPAPTEGGKPVPRRLVTLPYTYRHAGVEIRIRSVEVRESELWVNATLQELRGRNQSLSWKDCLQAQTQSGTGLPLARAMRADGIREDGASELQAHEERDETVIFALPKSNETVQLLFSSGAMWTSQ